MGIVLCEGEILVGFPFFCIDVHGFYSTNGCDKIRDVIAIK